MTKIAEKQKSLLDLESGECRWPVGDPRKEGFHFCGAQQVMGRPYCIEHWPLSFVPGRAKQPAGQDRHVIVQQLPAPRRAA